MRERECPDVESRDSFEIWLETVLPRWAVETRNWLERDAPPPNPSTVTSSDVGYRIYALKESE